MEIHPVSCLELRLVLKAAGVLGCCPSMLCTTPYYQVLRTLSIMMEIALLNKANDPELDHWLSPKSRCFGDKGDVEDITEG